MFGESEPNNEIVYFFIKRNQEVNYSLHQAGHFSLVVRLFYLIVNEISTQIGIQKVRLIKVQVYPSNLFFCFFNHSFISNLRGKELNG